MKTFLNILLIVIWISLGAGAVVLMSFTNQIHDEKSCSGLEIVVDHSGSEPLVTSADLKKQIERKYGDYRKKKIDEVNLEELLEFLEKNPVLDYVDAHITLEGVLKVEVEQCKPLVRLISQNGEEHLLDSRGKILPVNSEYPVRVVIANGDFQVSLPPGKRIFSDDKNKKQPDRILRLQSIHAIAVTMENDSVLSSLIEQINIKPDGNIRLASKAGHHTIEFGDTSDMNAKFDNLKSIYKYGLSRTGWDKYKTINLKYKNQVVCTK